MIVIFIFMKEKKTNWLLYSFLRRWTIWTYGDFLKKVKPLDTAKASQQFDIPTKISKQNSDYFAECFYGNVNQCILKSIFASDLKLADVNPVFKRSQKTPKRTIGQ